MKDTPLTGLNMIALGLFVLLMFGLVSNAAISYTKAELSAQESLESR